MSIESIDEIDAGSIIGVLECSTMASTWTEYLCMQVANDGEVTLTSKSREVLGADWTLEDQEVIWPEGFDPNGENDDIPLPISIDGKKVIEIEDGCYMGSELMPHAEDATASFRPGQVAEAEKWVRDYYRGSAVVSDDVIAAVRVAIR